MAPAPAPPASPVAQPTSSVDSLLAQTGTPRAQEGPRKAKGKGKRKGQKKEVDPFILQKKVIRLSFIVIIFISIVGYVGRLLNREFSASTIWNNGVVDLAGVFGLGAAMFLWMRAVAVSGHIRERVSPAEQSGLSYIKLGVLLFWLVPLVGSFGYYVGIVFQSSNMHWIFYVIVGLGALAILKGLAGSKERGSFYQIYMFGVYGIIVATIPMAFSFLGDLLASSFWWTGSFIMISVGFILMAIMVRQMRADQYQQLDKVLEKSDKSFANRRFDEAQKHYSEAITLTHTLYADVVFSGRNPRERGGTSIPQEYFRPWIGKAKCLALTGKLRKALAIYDLMLEVDPDNAPVWFDRGRILVAEKRHAEAYISFDRAVKLDPNLNLAKEKRTEVLDVIRKMSG
jgi:tetratricopeptide (TPR) repeat protein